METYLPPLYRSPRLTLFLAAVIISGLFYIACDNSFKTLSGGGLKSQLERLEDGRFFTDPDGNLEAFETPLFPLTAYLVRETAGRLGLDRHRALFATLAVMAGLAAVFLFNLSSLIYDTKTAFIPPLLYITHIHILTSVVKSLDVVPVSFFLFLSLYFLLLSLKFPGVLRNTVYSGLATGFCLLTQWEMLFLPLLFITLLFVFSRKLSWVLKFMQAGIFAACVLAVLFPWEVYMYSKSGQWHLLTQGKVYSIRNGVSLNNKPHRGKLNLPRGVENISRKFYNRYEWFQSPRIFAWYLWDQFKKEPISVTVLIAIKAARSWYGTESHNRQIELFNLFLIFIYMIPILWGGYGVFKNAPQHVETGISVLLTVLLFWATTTSVLSVLKAMIPAIGLCLVFIPGIWSKSYNYQA